MGIISHIKVKVYVIFRLVFSARLETSKLVNLSIS